MPFFQLAWLIPVLPLAAFVFITLFSPLYRVKTASSTVAILAMLIATLLAWGLLWQGATQGFGPAETASAEEHEAGETHFAGFGSAYTASVPWTIVGESGFRMGYYVDAPVALMLAMVTLTSLCIHLFSSGY